MITLASYITMIRMILTPVVWYYVHLQQWAMAVIFFIIAAFTDLLDGFVARRFNQQSKFGQLLDPVADKYLIMTTLYGLLMNIGVSFLQQVMVWCLLAKEAILLFGGAWLKLRYDFFIKPSRLSRAASIAEIIVILFLFASLLFFGHVSSLVLSILLCGNLVLSVWLLVRYGLVVKQIV